MEAECRVSAELRAELQKAKEEIHTLRETLRLYQPLSGSAAESPHGATQLSEVRANSWAESEKADRLTQSGSLEAESADTAAKGSYVKAEGKVYWVSYEDPEQLIRLPARHSSEKSARLSASEARPDAEPSRRLSGHEKFLPGTPEDHLPRPMRPASLDPHRPCTAYFAAGTGGRAPIYVQPVMPMSARRTLPPQHQRPMVMGVHGLPRQASSGHFLPATLRHQFSTGSLSSVQYTQTCSGELLVRFTWTFRTCTDAVRRSLSTCTACAVFAVADAKEGGICTAAVLCSPTACTSARAASACAASARAACAATEGRRHRCGHSAGEHSAEDDAPPAR